MVSGQAPGMLLELRRAQRRPIKALVLKLLDGAFALGMQDEDRGRDLAAFQQNRHGEPQSFNRRLENKGGLSGDEPSRVILKQSSLNAEPRSPYQDYAQQDPDDSKHRGRDQGGGQSTEMRPRPLKAQRDNGGKRPKQDERHGCPENPAPAERIPDTDLAIRAPAHPSDTAVTLPAQFSDGFESFLAFDIISKEDSGFHSLSLREEHHRGLTINRSSSLSGGCPIPSQSFLKRWVPSHGL